ncbi:MlaD family protein [Phascolarctobacterium sp.]|uniref:MlaD family protein n=1 Tax=Phascolarctobacterium sp. TaxID=2049039 RepID=UPI0015ABD959|nr:MlaD family protein [uncultured Phascolarctobacterium sp.]
MSSNEVKVGALTLGGVGLLAGIITFLGAFSFSGGGYELQISYPQVGGLMPGHVVRYAGVQVGTVKEVNVQGDSVDVVADINKDIKIPKGAIFSLGSDGILGERFVDVLPPVKMTGQYIHPGDKLDGEQGTGLDEFMNASSKVLAKVEGIAEALNNVFGDPEVQRSMRDGFVNARDISNNMNTFTKVMADVAVANQQEITLMVQQMGEMAARMNNAAGQMENIMVETNQGGAGQNMARIIENLANASGRIEKATELLEKVATDPQTEADIKATLHNAREASDKANRMLGVLDTAKIQADVSRSVKGKDWRSNLGVTFTPNEDTFMYIGGYDIGDSNKLDLSLGKQFGQAAVSMGAMQGEFGVGFDYKLGNSFKLYSQVYDFNDTKVKIGGELKLTDNLSLLGEQTDVRKGNRNNTYVGLRSYF